MVIIRFPPHIDEQVPRVDIHFSQECDAKGMPTYAHASYKMPDCDTVRTFHGTEYAEAVALARMDVFRRHVGLDWAKRLEVKA